MQTSLEELMKQCQALGLIVIQNGKRPAKEDYARELRAYHLAQDRPGGLPYVELTPMLCFPYWKLNAREQARIWEDNNGWVAQRKLNGVRIVLHFIKDLGVFAHSRTVSEQTFRRVELSNHFLFAGMRPDFSAVADSEAIIEKPIDTRPYTSKGEITKSSLHSTTAALHLEAEASRRLQREQQAPLCIHVFDITNWQGEDLRSQPLDARLGCMLKFQQEIKRAADITQHFAFPEIRLHSKRAFFDEITGAGGEGVVLKNLSSTYHDNNSRDRHAWVKCKNQISFEAFCSGFDPAHPDSAIAGKIACLHFSVMIGKEKARLIAKISNLPWEFRKQISVFDRRTYTVSLDTNTFGRVATISGFEFSGRAARLVSPRIDHWRSDLRPEDCRYNQQDLDALRNGATGKTAIRISTEGKKLSDFADSLRPHEYNGEVRRERMSCKCHSGEQ